MRARAFFVAVALLLLVPLGGLTSLAYASPPDPSWISGIYDGADYDDVVVMLTSAAATNAPVLLEDLRPIPPRVGPAPELAEDPVSLLPFASLQPRAPPAS